MDKAKENQYLTEAEQLELEQVKRERGDRRQMRRENNKAMVQKAEQLESKLIGVLSKNPFNIERNHLFVMADALALFLRKDRVVAKTSIPHLKWVESHLKVITDLSITFNNYKNPDAISSRGVTIEAIIDGFERELKVAENEMPTLVRHLKSMPVFTLWEAIQFSAATSSVFVFAIGMIMLASGVSDGAIIITCMGVVLLSSMVGFGGLLKMETRSRINAKVSTREEPIEYSDDPTNNGLYSNTLIAKNYMDGEIHPWKTQV